MTHSTTSSMQQNAAMVKRNKKSLFCWLVFVGILLLMPSMVMSQNTAQKSEKNSNVEYVKFVEVSATKTYPEGNQITYVKAIGLPQDKALAEKMEHYLINVMRVTRVRVMQSYEKFMFDGDADINPEWVVDEMNVFFRNYYEMISEENE